MRFISIFFSLFILAISIAVLPAYADTRYVDDQLIITLRAGKGADYKIIQTLKTGTPVEVLEEDDNTYLKVKISDGTEGYVLRQYITSSLPKTVIIERLEQEKSSLQKKIQDLEDAKNSLQAKYDAIHNKYNEDFTQITSKSSSIEQSLEQALKNERSLAEKYNTLLAQSKNVVEITTERDRLLEINKKLAVEVENLQRVNDKMSDSRMIKWFLAGGGVFLFGWIIGKISRRKRSRL
jgi:SH3 domain protein